MKKFVAAVLAAAMLAAPVMATADLAVAPVWSATEKWGHKKCIVADITFDTSYPTGGETLTPALLGLTAIDFASVAVDSCKTFEVEMRYNYSTGKILAFYTANGDTALPYRQPKATSNLALCTARFVFIGR